MNYIDYLKNITNMNDITITFILLISSLIIFISFILYWLVYLRNLYTNECKYFDKLYPKINGNLRPINKNDEVCKYTLNNYYIKTAYNCCSGGSYANDYVSTCILKKILSQGVRGLDFQIFSIQDKPVVATSLEDNYYIKETFNSIPFNEIMNILHNYAFSMAYCPNATDPLIIHLRFQSKNSKMYDNLAKILESHNDILLGKSYSYENNKQNFGNTPILNLQNKISIIVDASNPEFMKHKNFYEYVNMTSNSLYMRALRYYDIKYTPDMNELIEYNKLCMTIALPDKGNNPSNMSSALVRELGCQMISMRYELYDNFLKENEIFFNEATYAFVLKPINLRYKEITIPDPTIPSPSLNYAPRKIKSDYYNFNI